MQTLGLHNIAEVVIYAMRKRMAVMANLLLRK